MAIDTTEQTTVGIVADGSRPSRTPLPAATSTAGMPARG